jgi:transposase
MSFWTSKGGIVEEIEIMPRVEPRRKWTEAEKARLLAEADEPGSSVVDVARNRGISRSLLYNWRAARKAGALAALPGNERLEFVPLGVIGGMEATKAPKVGSGEPGHSLGTGSVTGAGGAIEIELISGVRVRVDAAVNETALWRVLRAMKGTL